MPRMPGTAPPIWRPHSRNQRTDTAISPWPRAQPNNRPRQKRAACAAGRRRAFRHARQTRIGTISPPKNNRTRFEYPKRVRCKRIRLHSRTTSAQSRGPPRFWTERSGGAERGKKRGHQGRDPPKRSRGQNSSEFDFTPGQHPLKVAARPASGLSGAEKRSGGAERGKKRGHQGRDPPERSGGRKLSARTWSLPWRARGAGCSNRRRPGR